MMLDIRTIVALLAFSSVLMTITLLVGSRSRGGNGLAKSDAALYEAKRAGRNCVALDGTRMGRKIAHQSENKRTLSGILDQDTFRRAETRG
jgi:hypothetical protein